MSACTHLWVTRPGGSICQRCETPYVTDGRRVDWEADAREARRREVEHRRICFGFNCISCGCARDRACSAHSDSNRWTNTLLERIARALEAKA